MTIFKLVKIALDQLEVEAKEQHGPKLDEKIIEKMEYLSESYKQLTDSSRSPVDYKDAAIRFAYVYKYVAAHGDYLVQVLEMLLKKEGPIFKTENVRISCLGGGPGSDIVAVLKYLGEHRDVEPVKKLTCYLLDREQAWADIWTEINDSLSSIVNVNVNFQPFDITNTESWKSQRRFLQADLFTMIYFVSEVLSLDHHGMVTKSWRDIFKSAKSGALFVFIDNAHTGFTTYFDEQSKAAGLEPVLVADDQTWTPRFSERASELAGYRKRFGQSPKLRSQLSYRVLRKP